MSTVRNLFDYDVLREHYFQRMYEEGYCITVPGENELQIDIDCEADLERHHRAWEILKRDFALCDEDRLITVSKSGTGKHIRITMPHDMTPPERIAFQAALGSDPVRELLSLVRLKHGVPYPTVLVETPDTVEEHALSEVVPQ